MVADIFFASFFACLIVLNLLFKSFSFSHISLSFSLTSCFNFSFFYFLSWDCSRRICFCFSACCFSSSSSPSLNSLNFLTGFCSNSLDSYRLFSKLAGFLVDVIVWCCRKIALSRYDLNKMWRLLFKSIPRFSVDEYISANTCA